MVVEIACIIDRSGSMSALAVEAIGGFNAFLADQQALPGAARLTLVLFDHEYLKVADAVPLAEAHPLTPETYVPRGMTALYDAVGRTIDEMGTRFAAAQDKPSKVIVVILTDGHENASQDYDRFRLAAMIEHQRMQYAWEFVFLAANQDAVLSGAALNIPASSTVSFSATSAGVACAYADMSLFTSELRTKT